MIVLDNRKDCPLPGTGRGTYRIDMRVNVRGYFITLSELFGDFEDARKVAQEEASLTGCPCRIRRVPAWNEEKKTGA